MSKNHQIFEKTWKIPRKISKNRQKCLKHEEKRQKYPKTVHRRQKYRKTLKNP